MIQKELLGLYYKLKNRVSLTLATRLRSKHHCLLCHTLTTKRICQSCQTQFLHSPIHRCTCCGIPLTHNALFCGDCLQHTPCFDRTFSPFIYQTPLSDLIIRFKEKHDFFAGKALSDVFTKQIQDHYVQQHIPLPDLIVAVPQHWKKQWARGFNPAAFFADTISRQLSIPIFTDVKRTKAVAEQKNLSRHARIKNLQRGFTITSQLQGENVAIIDDVMTTGSTANALAQALKKAGAKQVTIWALARTPKDHS
jgi:ComF family protein